MVMKREENNRISDLEYERQKNETSQNTQKPNEEECQKQSIHFR